LKLFNGLFVYDKNRDMKLVSMVFALYWSVSFPGFNLSNPSISINDFTSVIGNWKGSLTYLDYTSGKPYTMPADVIVSTEPQLNRVILEYKYPNEPHANGKDTLKISKEGTMLDAAFVKEKKLLADSTLRIVTERNGFDGNDHRKAVIRHTWIISAAVFSNREDIKFEGEQNWIERNQYTFHR